MCYGQLCTLVLTDAVCSYFCYNKDHQNVAESNQIFLSGLTQRIVQFSTLYSKHYSKFDKARIALLCYWIIETESSSLLWPAVVTVLGWKIINPEEDGFNSLFSEKFWKLPQRKTQQSCFLLSFSFFYK